MNRVHDVGGKPGYGAPQLESKPGVGGSAFAARWEAAVFAMMRCLGAQGVMKNTDQFRHAVERVDPTHYFNHGYYGRWLGGLETLLVEADALDRAELDARVGELARRAGVAAEQIAALTDEANVASRPKAAEDVDQVLMSINAGSSVRYMAPPPAFNVGDKVLTRHDADQVRDGMHTRLPAYARNCQGRVVAWHGGWVFPDSNAHGAGESPCHLYTVAFAARELYGAGAETGVVVHLDLFEPYLSIAAQRDGQKAPQE